MQAYGQHAALKITTGGCLTLRYLLAVATLPRLPHDIFSAAPRLKAIAVLHPRKLGVYTVEAVGGRGGKASFFNLVKAYEHALGSDGGGHFTSCNMTHGGFGGVSRDLLCVQSMDGRLQVMRAGYPARGCDC